MFALILKRNSFHLILQRKMGANQRLMDRRWGRSQLWYKKDIFFQTWPFLWIWRWSHFTAKYSYDRKWHLRNVFLFFLLFKCYSYGIVLKLCHYIPFVFPFQSALRSMKYSGDLVKVAFTSMLEILKQTIIAEYKVKDVLWGIDHPLVKLANDILPEVSLWFRVIYQT